MSLSNTDTRRDPASYIKKTIPQTLFLGASVSNFTTNLGWGAQASSLSVNLVTDSSGCANLTQISMNGSAGGGFTNDNHYYDTDDIVRRKGRSDCYHTCSTIVTLAWLQDTMMIILSLIVS